MTRVLVRKLLRDTSLFLIVVVLLLFLFQLLWARITYQISVNLVPFFEKNLPGGAEQLFDTLFKEGPAQIVQTLIVCFNINLRR